MGTARRASAVTGGLPFLEAVDLLGPVLHASAGRDDMTPEGDALTTTADGKTVLRGGFRTVLEDSNEYHVKHPLQSHWTLHQKIGSVVATSSRSVSQSEWEERLKESVTIGTVEDFWCLYNEMQPIDTIPTNCDYFFMRVGVRPMWEDAANVGGGEMRLNVSRSMDAAALWQRALLFVVGCQADDYAVLNGVQFAFRPTRNRLSLWLGAASPEVLDRVRDQFGAALADVTGDTPLRLEFFPFSKPPSAGRGDRGDRPDRGDRSDRPDRAERRDDSRGARGWGRGPSSGGGGPTSPSGGTSRRH